MKNHVPEFTVFHASNFHAIPEEDGTCSEVFMVLFLAVIGTRAGYATLQTGNDIPNVGYATVYPAAMIVKILLAQVLLSLLT